MKESERWLAAAKHHDGDVARGEVGLCQFAKTPDSIRRLDLFKPDYPYPHWWGCGSSFCGPKYDQMARVLAALFLYHMALDSEKAARRKR